MTARSRVWVCLCLVPVLGIVAPLPAGEGVLLDETAYLRRYYRFGDDPISPAVMKAQGQQILGDALFDRLKKETEKWLSTSGNDNFAVFHPSAMVLRQARSVGTTEALKKPAAGAADWRECLFRRMFFDPYTAPPPADNWAAADFDDRSWVLDRGPFQIDMPNDLPPEATAGNMAKVHVGALQFLGSGIQSFYYRARFVIDDPAQAADLKFRATYRGGIRVLVNGQEIARGHLPKGNLAPETAGDDYPADAYDKADLRDRTLVPVAVPAACLKKGVNVLAVEVRSSTLHPLVLKTPLSKSWNAWHDREGLWRHGFLGKFALTGGGGAPAGARPDGVQAWPVDIHHRVVSTDFFPAGEETGRVRMVAPQNASCSGQIVIRSKKALPDLKVTVSDLTVVDSTARIPASAFRVLQMLPFPAEEMSQKLGDERGLGGSFPTQAQLERCAAMGDKQPYVFDQITPRPQPLPADTSRPVWLSLKVPPDAMPARYFGQAFVRAEDRVVVYLSIVVDVVDWRMPDAKDFQTYVGLEQNPYGVAKQYGVKLWSDEHLKLLRASFEQLARAGNRWLNVPVIRASEFGNRDDSPIRFVRKKDGAIGYDFGVLDKYLDLAVEVQGTPWMIDFAIMPGMGQQGNGVPAEVMVFDEATGKAAPLPCGGPNVSLADKKKIWEPFATALYEHMKARKLDKAMHWGYPLDSEVDHELVDLMGKHLPQVKWTGGPHQIGPQGFKEPKYYDVFGTVRYFDNWPGFRMTQGWKAPQVHLTIPRIDSSVCSLTTASYPFAFRVLIDHSLAMGRCGFERVGADEWASAHYDGMKIPTWIVGMPVLFVLWPGPGGAESSARFEALVEGIQEGEARLFLEKAIDAKKLPEDLAKRVQEALSENSQETGFFQNKLCIYELEQYTYRWQDRSARLFRLAADAAKAGAGK